MNGKILNNNLLKRENNNYYVYVPENKIISSHFYTVVRLSENTTNCVTPVQYDLHLFGIHIQLIQQEKA